FLYEVAEAIRLDALRSTLKAPITESPATVSPHVPQYLHFERPPVVERIDVVLLSGGVRLDARAKYYDYGGLSIELELPFEGSSTTPVSQPSTLIGAADSENHAPQPLRTALKISPPAFARPYEHWLRGDFFIVQISEIPASAGRPVPA